MLPTKPNKDVNVDPLTLLIYSAPKVGKTVMVKDLPNHLLLDFERGSEYAEGVNAIHIKDLRVPPSAKKETEEQKKQRHEGRREFFLDEVIEELSTTEHNFEFIILDTATTLEERCGFWATWDYMHDPKGKSFNRVPLEKVPKGKDPAKAYLPVDKWKSVLTLPQGAGYLWLRNVFKDYLSKIKNMPNHPKIILMGHVKDKEIEKGSGIAQTKDIDLMGKDRLIATALFADTVGYLYRREEGKNVISFKTTGELSCGSRSKHLSNEEIVISEMDKEGNLKTHWDKIYPSSLKESK